MDGSAPIVADLVLVRAADAGAPQFQRLLGPFAPGVREVRLRVDPAGGYTTAAPDGTDAPERVLTIVDPDAPPPTGPPPLDPVQA